jgi:hypothetical protein
VTAFKAQAVQTPGQVERRGLPPWQEFAGAY